MPARSNFSFSHRIRLLLAFILILLPAEAALSTLLPLAVYFFAGGRFAHDRNGAYLMLGILAGAAALGLLAGLLRDHLAARAQSRVLGRLRMVMFERVQRMSPARYGNALEDNPPKDNPPELFDGDLDQIDSAMAAVIPRAALPLTQAILSAAVIFWFDWRAGIVGLLFWPWVILAPALGHAAAARSRDVSRQESDNLTGLVRETLRALPMIRIFALEQQGTAGFRKRSDLLSQNKARINFRTAFMERFAAAGILFIHIALLAASVLLVLGDRITFAGFAAIQLSGYVISHALLTLTGYLPVLGQARQAWDRIGELLETPAALRDSAGALALPPLASEIGFADVTFGYDGKRDQIAGVTARIPRGACVAFVGESGAGKSTLLQLLMRFYDPEGGRITMDGHDLRTVTRHSLRAQMGIVPEENSLLNVSIRDNIRLGRPEASAEGVVIAATAAGLHEHIMGLPRGYDTMADASVHFSASGLQRLALARAILRDPEILLFDEATSPLDPVEEAALLAIMRTLRKGRTVISTAHRLSTTADADHIFVLDKGAVIEQGNHSDLMALDGMYAWQWRKQAGFRFLPEGVQVELERLKVFPVLENLSDPALAELAPFFATETFEAGREIVHQNDPGDKFYILARGKAEMDPREDFAEKAVLQDGDCFADLNLLTGLPHTATVRALTLCVCLTLSRSHFNGLLERYPDMKRAMLETAVRSLRESAKSANAAGL